MPPKNTDQAADAAPEVLADAPALPDQAADAAPVAVEPVIDPNTVAPPPAPATAAPVQLVTVEEQQRITALAVAEALRADEFKRQGEAAAAEVAAAAKKADEEAAKAGGYVKCRVLPLGHKKISTGETDPSKPQWFIRGDEFRVAADIGEQQETNGFVEIVG